MLTNERDPTPHRSCTASVARSTTALVSVLLALVLAACTPPADPHPFADATAALSSAVRTSGQAVESQLRSSTIPNADKHADDLHAAWATRVAVMEQTVAYADGLRAVYDAAADSAKTVHQIASDVSSIASAAGLVVPPAGAVAGGVDIGAIVYQNINNARAARTIADSLEYADHALAGIAHHLETDTARLREILELAHADATSRVMLADKDLDVRFERTRQASSDLMTRAATIAPDQLERLSSLNGIADSQAALIAARDQRLAEVDARFAAQAALIDAANGAMADWAAAHSRLAAAVRDRRPVSVESIVETTTELRELIRKVRDQ
jgi:hypothetical protein